MESRPDASLHDKDYFFSIFGSHDEHLIKWDDYQINAKMCME